MKHTPCGNCPFRKDVAAYIRPERGREIRASLQRGGMFPCHKTVDYDDSDDEGEGRVTVESIFCGGALALMEKNGGAYQNQMVRISSRLGLLDIDEIDKDTVPDTWEEWFGHLGEEKTDLEYCDVAEADCENACATMEGGQVVGAEELPACEESCPNCGNYYCGACSTTVADQVLCLNCAEDGE